MKIEIDLNTYDAARWISIAAAVVAIVATLTFGIAGCLERTELAKVNAGLVEKQNTGSQGVHWTKP